MTLNAVGAAQSYARAIGENEVERRRASTDPDAGADAAPSHGEQPTAADAISVEDVTSARAKTNLIALAGNLGVDPGALLAHVSSGQSIKSLLSGGAEARYGASISPGGGIAIDQYV